MEDEGRQRTTKFISRKFVSANEDTFPNSPLSHETLWRKILFCSSLGRFVSVSDQLQLFAKEQEKNKLLSSSAPQMSKAEPATPKTPTTPKTPASKAKKKTNRCKKQDSDEDWANNGLSGKNGKARRKSGARRKISAAKDEVMTTQTTPADLLTQPAAAECGF